MKILKKILYVFGFLCFLLIGLIVLSRIFEPKRLTNIDNMYTHIIKGFYNEEKNSLDVMFMGNSDVYRGIAPIELWDEYGITSYSYTSPGQRMWTGYYILKDALKYQHPKVIFFNVDSLFNETSSSDNNYRKVFDGMPNDEVKFEAINDPIYNFSLKTKISFYFPIFRFHSRYNELTEDDFKYAFYNGKFDYKGMDLITTKVPYEREFRYLNNDYDASIPTKCKKYLDLIIELCKKENINIVLFELPSADSWTNKRHETTALYAKEHNVPFLDFNYNTEEFDFNWLEDTSDGGDHLNVYGATKITRQIGKYIDENYDLKDHRSDKNYSDWNESSKKYHEDIILKENGKLSNY